MKSLNELKPNSEGIVASIDGDARYLSRITSIGITPGCHIKVLKNDISKAYVPMIAHIFCTTHSNLALIKHIL